MQNKSFSSYSLKDNEEEILKEIKSFKKYYSEKEIKPLFSFEDFYKDKKIILSVSGGADSMSLLVTFMKFRQKNNIDFEILNFEHGIREDKSRLDSFFVKNFAKTFKIKFRQIDLNVKEEAKTNKINLEELARNERKKYYQEEKESYIFLAHNSQDNQDTILMNIFRGSGLNGLIGMKKISNNIVRPMLKISREEIKEFVLNNKIPFRHDNSNDNIKYSRNLIRKKIRPEINKVWNLENSLNNLSLIVQELKIHIDKLVEEYLERDKDIYKISIKKIEEDKFIASQAIIKALEELKGQKDITKIHIDSILCLKDKEVGKTVELPNSFIAIRENKYIYLYKKDKNKNFEEKFSINTDKLKITKEKIFKIEKDSIYIDEDKLSKNAIIRTRKNGDKFLRFNGTIVSLSNYLTNKKIEKIKKEKLVLIEDNNIIKAVIPFEVSNDLKIDENTKNILKIKLVD